jgi:HSP20 family protein
MSLLIHKGNGLRNLREEMDHLFESFITPNLRRPEAGALWSPAVDLKENSENFVVTAELPGMNKDDIQVEVENNLLTIRGERKFEKKEEHENYHFVERSYGSFYRSFMLPAKVNAEAIVAEYKDGILHVTLPKREEVKPKKVEIKV